MSETHDALLVDENLRGDPSQFEQVEFLPVAFQDAISRVGQADEGEFARFPVHFEVNGIFRSDHNDLGSLRLEFRIVSTQLRHVPLAERSHEAAVKDQQHVGFAFEIR